MSAPQLLPLLYRPEAVARTHTERQNASTIAVSGGLSLAYIGTDSRTAQRDEHDHRSSRFRLGGKKEAAGVCRGRGGSRYIYIYIYMEFQCPFWADDLEG